MRKRSGRGTLLLLACLAAGMPVRAQHDTLRVAFRTITIQDGLSAGMINGITQDRAGYMWFGTKDGLNRYDGYDFTVFRHDPADSTSLGNSHVESLLATRDGLLWVGTGSGLDVFDPATERFHHVALPGSGTAAWPSNLVVNRLAEDSRGRIWALSHHGLFMVQPPRHPLGTAPLEATLMPSTTDLRLMTMDAHGMLRAWRTGSLVTVQFDTRQDSPRCDTLRYTLPGGAVQAPALGLLAVSDTIRGRTYGVHADGIVQFDEAGHARPVSDGPVTKPYPFGVNVDLAGALWISSVGDLWRRSPDGSRTSRVLPVSHDHDRLVAAVTSIYRDRGGVLWIGTNGHGLLRYDPHVERFNPTYCGSVRWMAPCPDGSVLTWTDRPQRYDPATHRLVDLAVPRSNVHEEVSGSLNTFSTVQDGRGILWSNHLDLIHPQQVDGARTRPGLAREDLYYLSSTIYGFPLVLSGDTILCFGSKTNFSWLDLRTLRFERRPYPISDMGNAYHFVQAILRERQGVFWLGTMKGLLRHEPASNSWEGPGGPGQSVTWLDQPIFCLLDDPAEPDHYIWAGTNGQGLYRVDKSSGAAVHYGTAEGLPNAVVYGLLADDDGLLWMSTNKGIARLDPATGTFRSFAGDGLQSDEFNRYAYGKLADGSLLFGGVNGINQFDPRALRDDQRPVQVAITGIRLMNKPVVAGQAGSPLRTAAHLATELAVPYTAATMLTLDFASMEFSDIGNRTYRYQLEGFDPQAIEAGQAHSAVYTNLSPGDYTFKVWGRNRDGVWNPEPQRLIVRILPPWYMTRWARALFALALLGAGLLFLHLRTRSLRRHRDQLERTVQERTAEMRQAKERAEHSERVKQQFLANMSHEIRTPMHAIVGMNNALRRREHLPEQAPFLDAIAQSSSNLLGLVNQILDLSKIEAGRLVSEQLPFAPRAVPAAVAKVMRHRVEEKGLTLDTEVTEAVPQTLVGDPARLNQVLMNLVGNAIKFTERGGIRLTMDAKPLDSGAVMLRCMVQDSGIGIAAERLPRIFDEFTQADNSHTRKYGGSGLGLTITKRLVEMQGGTIEVESSPGEGSTFTVAIPYVRPADRPAPAQASASPERPTMEGLRILLVEDHAMNVMVAKAELTDAIPGVRIEVAPNGKVAVDLAAQHAYDLILMDVQMPEMDGYEATRAIRAMEGDRARVPILGITANVMRTELERCMEAGMDGHVTKPFQREELLAAMAQVLGRADR
jgi:signal transduction histidine kinase/CheY-like chemotaxis protein/ligand-binding sensor domain-containing protein